MSSERRHQLENNDLVALLGKINKRIEPYSKPIALLIAIAFIVLIYQTYVTSNAEASRSDATLQLIESVADRDPVLLQPIIDEYPDTTAGAWAKLYQGQQFLAEGLSKIFDDTEEAKVALEDAREALSSAASSSEDTLLVSRAHYGIAQAAEAVGDVKSAKESYEKVKRVNESDAMVKRAEERIAALSDPQTLAFLEWFGDQEFSPADPMMPPSTLPSGNQLPDAPEFAPTGIPTFDLGGAGEGTAPEGGLELPEGGSEEVGEESGEQTDAVKPEPDAEASTTPQSTDGDASSESPEAESEAAESEAAEPQAAEPQAAESE